MTALAPTFSVKYAGRVPSVRAPRSPDGALDQWVRSQELAAATAVPQHVRLVILLQEAAKSELQRSRARQDTVGDHETQRQRVIVESYVQLISEARQKLADLPAAADPASALRLHEAATEGIGCLSTFLPWSHTVTAMDACGVEVSSGDETVVTPRFITNTRKLSSVNARRSYLLGLIRTNRAQDVPSAAKAQAAVVTSNPSPCGGHSAGARKRTSPPAMLQAMIGGARCGSASAGGGNSPPSYSTFMLSQRLLGTQTVIPPQQRH